MVNFTPIESLVGGILIGLASAMLLLFNGKIAGISGIAGGLLEPDRQERPWRALFIAGLLVGGGIAGGVAPSAFEFALDRSLVSLIVAGLLVGFGTRLGSGCTSGHGVCGLGRLSPRSLAATITFIAAGASTVLLVRHLFGGAP